MSFIEKEEQQSSDEETAVEGGVRRGLFSDGEWATAIQPRIVGAPAVAALVVLDDQLEIGGVVAIISGIGRKIWTR